MTKERTCKERTFKGLYVLGLIGMIVFAAIYTLDKFSLNPAVDFIGGMGLGLAIVAMIVYIYQTAKAAKSKNK